MSGIDHSRSVMTLLFFVGGAVCVQCPHLSQFLRSWRLTYLKCVQSSRKETEEGLMDTFEPDSPFPLFSQVHQHRDPWLCCVCPSRL